MKMNLKIKMKTTQGEANPKKWYSVINENDKKMMMTKKWRCPKNENKVKNEYKCFAKFI